MTPPRLVFIDGLPGTGKSTTAQRLCLHLEALGHPARWWFEHETGHPIYADDDVRAARAAGGAAVPRLLATALDGWHRVAAGSAAGRTTIFESTLFQLAVGTQLLADVPHPEIVAHFDRTLEALGSVPAALVLLRPPDVAQAVHDACARRHPWFEAFLLQHLGDTPRGRRTGLRDLAGVVGFFTAMREVSDELFDRFPGRKLAHAPVPGDWAGQQRAVTDFLGLPPPVPPVPPPAASDYAGRFRSEAGGDEWTFAVDAAGVHFAGEHDARLFARGGDRFALEGSCAEVRFERDAGGAVRGLVCSGALPGLPSRWAKV